METYPVTRKLLAVLEALPREHQEQLLQVARAWPPPTSGNQGPPDRAALLDSSGRLDQEYLKLARSELQNPPDLATVRSALAEIPGSLTADCIAERDER